MSKIEIMRQIQKNKELLGKYSVKSIALFGSFARGEETRKSDIDFLVEFKKPTFRNYVGLLHELESLFHKDIDLVTKASLNKHFRPFVLKEAEYFEVG